MPFPLRSAADRTSSRGKGRSAAFTLVEMLVVIAIIVLVLAIIFPVLARLRGNARATSCLINHRSIAQAANQYATDNAGRLCSPRTDKLVPGVAHSWVNASGSGLAGGIETPKSLENGVLWPYMNKNYEAYRSPLDPSGRVRSYSINAYVGNVTCPDDYDCGNMVAYPAGATDLSTSALTKIPQPASTLYSINEESPVGYNQQGFVVDWQTPFWRDIPAFWDGYRVNASFADGSTQTLTIFGQRFIEEATAAGGNYTEPNEPGTWYAMRRFLLPGRLDY